MGSADVVVAHSDGPVVLLVLVNPRDGVTDAAFLDWYGRHHAGTASLPGLLRTRLLSLGPEQLLPHRAAGAGHRFLAIYELDGWVSLSEVAGRLHPARGTSAQEIVDIPTCRAGTFLLVTEASTAPALPAHAPEKPERTTVGSGGTGAFIAFTRPVDAQSEAGYNLWYDKHHLPETLLLDGVSRGRRYRRAAAPAVLAGRPVIHTPYLTYYDLHDVGAVPFDREVLLDWLGQVSIEHLGPPEYDRDFTQAFVYEDMVTSSSSGAS